jgi:hypothetical protein
MLKLRLVVVAFALLHGACGDETDGRLGGIVPGEGTADDVTRNVTLTPEAVVPVCAAAGSGATGAATLRITADDASLSVDDLSYASLSGPAMMAHIQAGAPGVAGPDVLSLDPMTSLRQVFTDDSYPSPAPPGAPADFASFLASARAGNAYVTIQTAACPEGEIRGQL